MHPLLVLSFILRADVSSIQPRRSMTVHITPEETLNFPSNVSEEDKGMITNQLGYVPTNLVSVSARRQTGSPLVLQTYSLNGGGARRKRKALGNYTPFPTLYWFCCPIVGKAVSGLEREGFVGILEDRLMEDTQALDEFIQSHIGYAKERWNYILPGHQDYLLQSERMTGMVRYSGVAGTDFKAFNPKDNSVPTVKVSIKCLHAHYAHYRSQLENDECDYPKNVVGKWTHELLQERNKELIL